VTPEIFIGYKNAAEIFEQYELYNNRQIMGYQTNDAVRDAFINSCFFSKEEKENNRFSHILWLPLQDVDNSYLCFKISFQSFLDSLIEGFIFHFLLRFL
jgi:hypothetical protein